MNNQGNIFYGEDGKPFLVICPKCGKENWAMAVALGVCTWCGYSAPNLDKEEINK